MRQEDLPDSRILHDKQIAVLEEKKIEAKVLNIQFAASDWHYVQLRTNPETDLLIQGSFRQLKLRA